MLYELINPSDHATFRAPDLKIAALVALILGDGRYAAEPIAEFREDASRESVPILAIGDGRAWWYARFDETIEDAPYSNAGAVAAALRTVCYGGPREREAYDAAMSRIDDPDERDRFVAEWNRRRRSSLNDIMGHAHRVAEKLENRPRREPPPT